MFHLWQLQGHFFPNSPTDFTHFALDFCSDGIKLSLIVLCCLTTSLKAKINGTWSGAVHAGVCSAQSDGEGNITQSTRADWVNRRVHVILKRISQRSCTACLNVVPPCWALVTAVSRLAREKKKQCALTPTRFPALRIHNIRRWREGLWTLCPLRWQNVLQAARKTNIRHGRNSRSSCESFCYSSGHFDFN